MITAKFMNRRGAGCTRIVKTAAEAEKILRGGYGALEATLETEDGTVIGERRRQDFEDGRFRWFWTFDQSYFDNGTA